MKLYRAIPYDELENGEPIQFFAVHVLTWERELKHVTPKYAFVDLHIDPVESLKRVEQTIRNLANGFTEGDVKHILKNEAKNIEADLIALGAIDPPAPPPEGERVFTACKYLQFERAKIIPETVMVQVSTGPGKPTKVCWDRWNGERRELAQICKMIGTLHGPMNCLDYEHKRCNNYEEGTHEVPFKDIDLS